MARRPYGKGTLFTHRGAWYGQWRVGGRLVKRKLGLKRVPGSREGLTRTQADRELGRLMQGVRTAPSRERLTVAEAGERYLRHVEVVLERKPTTVADYGSILRRHLGPHFGTKPLERIEAGDLDSYVTRSKALGLATKTISNHLNFASGLFGFAVKRGWMPINPAAGIDRPRSAGANPDIRYIGREEVEALVRAVPDDLLGPSDRVLYLTATMTGLRQGELLALRWLDIDWAAGVIRVRRSITRGRVGTPKSRRSSRAVPIADRLTGELDRHFRQSRYQADEDLVFAHPETGSPRDPSRLRRRFAQALRVANLRSIRFHDLRHTFGTQMAGVGVPLRTLQEWMGHGDYATTLIYADYLPNPAREHAWAEEAFGDGEVNGKTATRKEHRA